MAIEDNDGDLATQYVLARRQRPDLNPPELAEYILAKLGSDDLLRYAQEALPWAPDGADRRELALHYVQNFVLAMETDPDGDQGHVID
ncbi:MAG: hypothetical protein ACRDTC_07765 [Pseudonocardiaceae bacterium]